MNFYENLFNMIEPFFFPTMFLQPPADFLWHFTVVSTLQSLGVHMTSCHLWLAEFVSSVIYCYMQLSVAAKHSTPSLSKWDLVSSDSPPGVKAHYGAKWERKNEPNQMKAWNFLSFPIKSSPLGYPGLKEKGNRSTPRQALGEEENSSYKNPELRSCHICIICVLKAAQSSPLAVHQ